MSDSHQEASLIPHNSFAHYDLFVANNGSHNTPSNGDETFDFWPGENDLQSLVPLYLCLLSQRLPRKNYHSLVLLFLD